MKSIYSLQIFTRRLRHLAAFTLLELVVTTGIVSMAFASLMVLNARLSNMLRSANDSTLVTQTLQERLEMICAAPWSAITSEETPAADLDLTEDDPSDESTDPTAEALPDPTVFPDDLPDSSGEEPGILELISRAANSAAGLNNLTELYTITAYPAGSTPIRVRRNADGSLTVLSHNSDLADEPMIRVVVQLTWESAAGLRVRNQAGQIILTKKSQ